MNNIISEEQLKTLSVFSQENNRLGMKGDE